MANYKFEGRPRVLFVKPLVWTEKAAELMGYIAGDGHVSDHSVGLHFSRMEPDAEEHYLELMRFVFGMEPPKRCNPSPNHIVYYYGSRDLRDTLRSLGVKKGVPPEVRSSRVLSCAWLRGIFTADGSISKCQGQITISITDPELSGELISLVKGLGFAHGVTNCPARMVAKTGYISKEFKRLRINSASRRAFHDEVGFSTEHKQDTLRRFI